MIFLFRTTNFWLGHYELFWKKVQKYFEFHAWLSKCEIIWYFFVHSNSKNHLAKNIKISEPDFHIFLRSFWVQSVSPWLKKTDFFFEKWLHRFLDWNTRKWHPRNYSFVAIKDGPAGCTSRALFVGSFVRIFGGELLADSTIFTTIHSTML